ncbi:hypothetical protein SAMN04488008_101438 [Maribacter orientalis]|uniref:Uncharacterized protein n=1 Tax=Maribacter orientalis TaxID=228957 RepID=A0A1H7GU19_9FLAO|nr:hypothetical protein [Maribacter orientalis]SEK41509.1 hypothetical protein SAMN04488008_101438 [Maribacter orientalis]
MKKNIKNPFKTPQNYFDSFEDKLMDKLSTKESVMPKARGFTVPDNYFDTFNDKLTSKLNKETKVIPLYPIKKIMAIAASIAAIAIIFLGYNWNRTEELSISDLANTDIEAYFENNEFDLTSYEIAEVLPFTDTEFSNMLNSSIENENILDYLSDNTNDFEELNLQENE